MASDTQNVKIGVCRVYYDGNDLGYTKGGVEVQVTTDTYKVTVDQFGKTSINEPIMGRNVMVKVPLAETTIHNMVAIMPGATLVTDGAKASGTFTFGSNPAADETISVAGVTFTFKASATDPAHIELGASAAATIVNAAQAINMHPTAGAAVQAIATSATVLTIRAREFGTAGNSIAIAESTATAVTVSGATLSGGLVETKARVDVATGVGVNLLDQAKELRLHPMSRAADDKSEDFIVPLAATPGALTFAYKFEEERVYNVEFSGYPDPVTGNLFKYGDDTP